MLRARHRAVRGRRRAGRMGGEMAKWRATRATARCARFIWLVSNGSTPQRTVGCDDLFYARLCDCSGRGVGPRVAGSTALHDRRVSLGRTPRCHWQHEPRVADGGRRAAPRHQRSASSHRSAAAPLPERPLECDDQEFNTSLEQFGRFRPLVTRNRIAPVRVLNSCRAAPALSTGAARHRQRRAPPVSQAGDNKRRRPGVRRLRRLATGGLGDT